MAKKKITTSSKGSLIPLGDRVLVRPVDAKAQEKKLPSGILLPETVSKEKTDKGVVVAVGEGRISDDGKKIPVRVKVGQTVIFQWGDKFEKDGIEYFLVSEANILAIVNK